MKRFVALVLVSMILGFIFLNMFHSVSTLNSMDIKDRDSNAYTTRSVNGNRGEVIFGKSNGLEDGSANTVSAIVVDYRSFDTLGEVSVLFVSSLGVAFLLGGIGTRIRLRNGSSFILKVGSKIVFGFILIFGVYMFSHGHLTPGGGFPGGALIASAFLLLYLADENYRSNLKAFKVLEGTAGSLYVLVGIAGLLLAGYFLQNVLPTGTVGELFSAGVLPIVYVLIGLKVGGELTGIFDHFMHEEAVG